MPMELAYREEVKSAYLTWGDDPFNAPSATGQLHFDAVLSEEHERTAEVTSHTVEKGSSIVDHVRPNPDRVELRVFVSNTPVYSPDLQLYAMTLQLDPPGQVNKDGTPSLFAGGTSALLDKGLQAIGLQGGFPDSVSALVNATDGEKDYVQQAYNTLTRLRDTATILSIVTPHAVYFSMVLERMQMRRDPGTGTSANFELEFREIRVVSSSITDAPLPTIPQAAPKQDLGKKDTEKTPIEREAVGRHLLVAQGADPTNIFGPAPSP